MKLRLFLCFLPAITSLSCTDPSRQTTPAQNKIETKAGTKNKPPATFSDTIKINSQAAVFYTPDSLQLEKIKEISVKNEYETDVHNCFYLMRNARAALKKNWAQVHIIETSNNRYLLFIKADKKQSLIDLNSKGDMCGIFLFDGEKEPELADMMNIDTAIGFYFSK
jgi:hypothetical protein